MSITILVSRLIELLKVRDGSVHIGGSYVCTWINYICLCWNVLQATKLSLHSIEDKAAEELPVFTPAQLDEISDPKVIVNKMVTLETQCAQMKPNLGAIAEYKKKVCTIMYRHYLVDGSELSKCEVVVK